MTQKGAHTWDLIFHYHRCPKCGFIMECRRDYEIRMGKYVKELQCERCQHLFTLSKPIHPKFGPLIGEPQPAEMTWGN